MNLYQTLGVRRNASHATITRAYRKLIMKHHPDRNPPGDETAKAAYAAISIAYEVLSDTDRRAKYDATGETEPEKVNAVFAEVMSVLAPTFTGVVESIAAQGGDVKRENVVTHMERVIRDNRAKLKKMIADVGKATTAIETAVARLTMTKEEGREEDLLTVVARNRVLQLAHQKKQMEAEDVRIGKALDYLRVYRYRTDAPMGWGSSTTGAFIRFGASG